MACAKGPLESLVLCIFWLSLAPFTYPINIFPILRSTTWQKLFWQTRLSTWQYSASTVLEIRSWQTFSVPSFTAQSTHLYKTVSRSWNIYIPRVSRRLVSYHPFYFYITTASHVASNTTQIKKSMRSRYLRLGLINEFVINWYLHWTIKYVTVERNRYDYVVIREEKGKKQLKQKGKGR